MTVAPRRRQRGFLLVSVVVMLALLASIGLLLSTSASMDNAALSEHVDDATLDYVTEAGVAHAKWRLSQNTSCSAYSDLAATPFGGHSYAASYSPASGSPVSIAVTGTLANGFSRTRSLGNVRQFGTPVTLILQPGAEGKDTSLDSFGSQADFSYGGDALITVAESSAKHGLLEFDLSGIPPGVRVVSAVLEIYAETAANNGGLLSAHRVSRSWLEGSSSAPDPSTDGATWNTHDAANAWAAPGGDYDPTAVAKTTMTASTGWYSIDISALVAAWVDGSSANHGLLLRAEPGFGSADFTSSDSPTSSGHPKLTVIYACECGTGGSSGSTVLQPGAEGKDAYLIAGNKANHNTGAGKQIWISNSGAFHRGLIEFDLSGLPAGATVTSATLELYDPGPDAASAGSAYGLFRVTQGWVEGSGVQTGTSPADGVTWNSFDGVAPWATPGGDYDPAVIDTSPIPDLLPRWHQYDVTTTVAGWVTGTFANYGFLQRGVSGTIEKGHTATSDEVTSLNRPKLSISFSCPCGVPCTVSSGGGSGAGNELLFVVGDPANLTLQQQNKKALIEGWGYAVTMIATSESQAAFDAAAVSASVVYIPELGTTAMNELGNKADGLAAGVITEESRRALLLGGFALLPFVNSDTIDITDTSHYITETLPAGPVPLSTAVQTLWVLKPALATDLHVLGQLNGMEPGLAYVDTGERLNDGSPAPGRRVKLPWGANDFDVALFTGEATTLMQRAIEWGAGAAAGKNLLFVVANSSNLAADELAHRTTLESWNYTVEIIDDDAIQSAFDSAVANNDVVLITNSVTASNVNTKLVDAPIGVVSSEVNLADEFGFSSSIAWDSGTTVDVDDSSHYIMAPFPTGPLTILDNPESLAYLTGSFSPQMATLASIPAGPAVVALSPGANMHAGGTAAGRRVLLPWGGNTFTLDTLSVDGLTILQRSLEWASGKGNDYIPEGGGPSSGTYRDEFNTSKSYSGNDGTLSWSIDWTEINESDGAGRGDNQVNGDVQNYTLMLSDNDGGGEGVWREANLAGCAAATLSFDYLRNQFDNADDYVTVDASTDDGVNWVELDRFTGSANDSALIPASYDLTPYMAQNTRIRFLTSPALGDKDKFYADNVEIACEP